MNVRQSILYGDQRIHFTVRFHAAKSSRLRIHVEADGSVNVDAPEGVPLETVITAVRERARWIWRRLRPQQGGCGERMSRKYVSGEVCFYLGRRYFLKVMMGAPPSVKLWCGNIVVTTRSEAAVTIKALLDAWFRQRASEIFSQRLQVCVARHPDLRGVPDFRLWAMRKRWGSCTPAGKLVLNPQLVKAPAFCIDYVLMHELCHLKIHCHGRQFHERLGALMPDWRQRKRTLDNLAEVLLDR